nr:hypothetical protein HAGR004_24940 [Bdellovibrio sp. HAGR004]
MEKSKKKKGVRKKDRNSKANKELKAALKEFNRQDHTGKSTRRIVGEFAEVVGRFVRDKLKEADEKERDRATKKSKR